MAIRNYTVQEQIDAMVAIRRGAREKERTLCSINPEEASPTQVAELTSYLCSKIVYPTFHRKGFESSDGSSLKQSFLEETQ